METTLEQFKKHVLYEFMLNEEDGCGFTYSFNESYVPFFDYGLTALNYVRFPFLQRVFGKVELIIPTGSDKSLIINLNQDDCFTLQLETGNVVITHDIDNTIGVVSTELDNIYTVDELNEHLEEIYELFKVINESYVDSIHELINTQIRRTL